MFANMNQIGKDFERQNIFRFWLVKNTVFYIPGLFLLLSRLPFYKFIRTYSITGL